jgi:hypothetical protein
MSVLSQNTEESTGSDLTSLYSMKKLIKNYTTDVPVERTISEIQTGVSADRVHGFGRFILQNASRREDIRRRGSANDLVR